MLDKNEDVKISRGILLIRSKSGTLRIVKVLVQSKRGNDKYQIKCRFQKYVPEKPKRSKIPILIKNYNKKNIDLENFKTKKITESEKMSSDSKIPILKKLSQSLKIPKRKNQFSLSNVPNDNLDSLIFEKPKCEGLEEPYLITSAKNKDASKHKISKKSSKKLSLSEIIGVFKNVPQCSSEDTMPLSEIEEISTSYRHSSSILSIESIQDLSPPFSQQLHKTPQQYSSQNTISSSETEEISSSEQQSSSIQSFETLKVSIFKQLTSEVTGFRKKIFRKKRRSPIVVMAQYDSKKNQSGGDEEDDEVEETDETDSDDYNFKYIDSGLRQLRSDESKLILNESFSKHEKPKTPSLSDYEITPILSEIPSKIFHKKKPEKKIIEPKKEPSPEDIEENEEVNVSKRESSEEVLTPSEKIEEKEDELKKKDSLKPSEKIENEKDLEPEDTKPSTETLKTLKKSEEVVEDVKSEEVEPSKETLKTLKKSEDEIQDLKSKETKPSIDTLKKSIKSKDDVIVLKPEDIKPSKESLKIIEKSESDIQDLTPEDVEPSKETLKTIKKSEDDIKDLKPKETKPSIEILEIIKESEEDLPPKDITPIIVPPKKTKKSKDLKPTVDIPKKTDKIKDDKNVLKPEDTKSSKSILKKLKKFEDITFTVDLKKQKEDFCVHTRDPPKTVPDEFSEEPSSKEHFETSTYPPDSTTETYMKRKVTSSDTYNLDLDADEDSGSEGSVYSEKESSPTALKIKQLEQGKQVFHCQQNILEQAFSTKRTILQKTSNSKLSDSSDSTHPQSSRNTSISSVSQDSFFCDFQKKGLVKKNDNRKLNIRTFSKKSKSFTAGIVPSLTTLNNKERRRIKSKSLMQN